MLDQGLYAPQAPAEASLINAVFFSPSQLCSTASPRGNKPFITSAGGLFLDWNAARFSD